MSAFDPSNCIGSVCRVGPDQIEVNLPRAAASRERPDDDASPALGEVGQFVLVEARGQVAFGRIVDVRLPTAERLTVDPDLSEGEPANAIGVVHLLTSLLLETGEDLRGLGVSPTLGSNVYPADPELVSLVACGSAAIADSNEHAILELGTLPVAPDRPVRLPAEQLFGRHCAVFGTTGSGKSWTVARMIEQAARYDSKILLLDATGEFASLDDRVVHAHLGHGDEAEHSIEVAFPHHELVEDDLFALFTPSGEIQGPRLRAAIRSLKLAALLGEEHTIVQDGCIAKAGRGKQPYLTEYAAHAAHIHQPNASFDIHALPRQIELECVLPAALSSLQGTRDHTVWGEESSNEISMCDALVSRIQGYLQAKEFACLFDGAGAKPLPELLEEFLEDDRQSAMRISMKHLSFTLDVREVIANAIGRLLMRRAREGAFANRPLVVFLDEAHHFLDKQLGDEHSRYPLDSFELIAKEGRKYSLTTCLSTQRPGDVPDAVLSQIGTLIVHRLVNDQDRRSVEQGITHLDQSAARFLPTFAPGEAVIAGAYLSIPLSVQMLPPERKPDSVGADYDGLWRRAAPV